MFFDATIQLQIEQQLHKDCKENSEGRIPPKFLVKDYFVRFALGFVDWPMLFLMFFGTISDFTTSATNLRGFCTTHGAHFTSIGRRFRSIHFHPTHQIIFDHSKSYHASSKTSTTMPPFTARLDFGCAVQTSSDTTRLDFSSLSRAIWSFLVDAKFRVSQL